MADVTERIEKQMEGTNLALAAVAEVLQKMDYRLSKEDAMAEASATANAQALAKADLVKSIAQEVISVLKEETGLAVSGGERKAKATGGTPQNSDDSESSVAPTTKIEEQQNTIQASIQKNEEDEEEDEDTDMDKGADYKEDDDNADDEAANFPETEEKGEDDKEDDTEDELKTMKKQLAQLAKQLESTQSDMQKSITDEAETRLRKMGFREENGLKAPKMTSGLGLDTTPLVKSNDGDGDVAGQLSELSYKQLRDLQHKIETGNTDGVPRELLG